MEENNNKSDDKEGKRKAAAELRKANKPLMEKRRRERINSCLDQLKSILMDVTKKESSFYSKLEKADILEMTVKYLKTLKRQQTAVSVSSDPSVMNKYIAGFNECTSEVSSYLNSIEGLTTEVRSRMINHLADCLHRANTPQPSALSQITSVTVPESQAHSPQLNLACAPTPVQIQQTSMANTQSSICLISPDSSTTALGQPQNIQTVAALPQQPIPVQLVPAKLASGDTVYILANSQQIPVVSANVNLTNTNVIPDLTAQNINQNVAVLNNVVQGNVMKIEPITNVFQRQTSTVSSIPVLYSPKPSIQLEGTCSPVSSNEDTYFTDESASSVCPSSSFELSTADQTDSINQSAHMSFLSTSSDSSLQKPIEKNIFSGGTQSSSLQQVFKPSKSVSSTITRPQSPDSSFQTATTSTVSTVSSSNSQSRNDEAESSRQELNLGNPGVSGAAWRPW